MGVHVGGTPERPATFFDTAADFDAWLAEHHASETVLWMGLHKRHVTPRGLTWDDAVPVALCWGWIDSTTQTLGPDAVRQRWSPRRPGSTWSRANIAHVERLIAEGRMRPAGLAAFARRTDENSAVYSYEMGERGLADEHEALLRADAAASAFWDAATASYRKMVSAWVATAKREATRDQRARQVVEDCAAGRLVPPLRFGETPAWVRRAAAAADAAREGRVR